MKSAFELFSHRQSNITFFDSISGDESVIARCCFSAAPEFPSFTAGWLRLWGKVFFAQENNSSRKDPAGNQTQTPSLEPHDYQAGAQTIGLLLPPDSVSQLKHVAKGQKIGKI